MVLGCTHYPLLYNSIRKYTPAQINLVSQDDIVADSLQNYLNRHPEMEVRCLKNGNTSFYTTDNTELFNKRAKIFYGEEVKSIKVNHLTENV
jgi:glutamate racemase